jgi:hypothetical protein
VDCLILGPLTVNTPVDGAAPATTDGRAQAAVWIGAVSVFGLFFPPLLIAGIAGVYLGFTALRRIARSEGKLKGRSMALAGLGLGAVGTLLSLIVPGIIAYVYIYAAFHNGRMPWE